MAWPYSDTFSGGSDTLLSLHVADSSEVWTQTVNPLGTDATSARVSAAGRMYGAAEAFWVLGGVAPSADYLVEADINCVTLTGDGGVAGRATASGFYLARISGSTWQLYKNFSGWTLMGSWSDPAGAGIVGLTRHVGLRMVGSKISLYVDNIRRISVNDTDLSAAGRPGIHLFGTSTSATGKQLDNYATSTVSDPVLPPLSWPFRDSFSGESADTELVVHTADTGEMWAQDFNPFGTNSSSVRISAAGRAYLAESEAMWQTPVDAPTADYDVEADVYIADTTGDGGVTGRTSVTGFYLARLHTTTWELLKNLGGIGGWTTLGTSAELGGAGTTRRVRLRMIGTTISLWVDGVQKISVTDSSLTAAGRPGIHQFGSTTSTTGKHLDNYAAAGTGDAGPDITGPVLAITSPTNGTTVNGTITLTATASDASGVANVQWKVDGTNYHSADTSSPYTDTLDTTALSNASHTIAAVATDTLGNTSTTSVTVTVDNGGPTVAITSPANTAKVTGTINLTATASDPSGVASVQWKVDGSNYHSADTSSPYSDTLDTTGLTEGAHTIAAVATDTLGNTSTDSVSITVDRTAPVVTITSPSNTATVSGTINVQGTATDAVGVASLKLYVDGSLASTNAAASPYSISLDTSVYTETTHTITVRATDASGNYSEASVNVVVDNVALSIAITSPADGSTHSNSVIVVATVTGGDVDAVQFLFDGVEDGEPVTSLTNVYTKTIDISIYLNGTHSVIARVVSL